MSAAGLVWLASYPKSGNTWMRLLLATLDAGGVRPKLSSLGKWSPNSAALAWLESIVDLPTGLLSGVEQKAIRGEAYRLLPSIPDGPRRLKVHDRFSLDLFAPEITDRIIYIVRDPRDVAPSWANHLDVPLDIAIANMGRSDFALAEPGLDHRAQAEQRISSWSEHVCSWIEDQRRPLLLIRYEDLLADTAKMLRRVAGFLDIVCDEGMIAATVAACRFDAVSEAERDEGFNERLAHQDRFFRQGRSGGWRQMLDPRQILAIERDQGAVMARLGYKPASEDGCAIASPSGQASVPAWSGRPPVKAR